MHKLSHRALALLASLTILATGVFAAFPMLSAAAAETTYEKHIEPNQYESIKAADGTTAVKLTKKSAVGGSNVAAGWCLTDSEGTKLVSGEIVYKVNAPLKAVRFHSAYRQGGGSNWHNYPLEFYASDDGITWTKQTTVQTLGDVETNSSFANVYANVYDAVSFEEADGIRYLKVVTKITDGASGSTHDNLLPRIFGIDYNAGAEDVVYAQSFNLTGYESIQTTATGVTAKLEKKGAVSGTNVPAGWCLVNEDNSHLVSGEVVYKASEALKNLRIHSAEQIPGGWHNSPLSFAVSKDGTTWTEWSALTGTSQTLAGSQTAVNSSFPNVYATVYNEATFTEVQDIRYVKIITKINDGEPGAPSWARGDEIPRLFAIEYNGFNDESGAEPSSYTYNWGAASGESAPFVASTAGGGLTALLGQDGWNFKSYTPTVSNTKGSAGGLYLRGPVSYGKINKDWNASLIFSTEEIITDFSIIGAFLDLDICSETQVKLFATKDVVDIEDPDSADWTELTFNHTTTEYSVGYGGLTESRVTKLYGKLNSSDEYLALKVTLYTPTALVTAHNDKKAGYDGYAYCAYGINSVSFNTIGAGASSVPSRYENEVQITTDSTTDNEFVWLECADGVVLDSPHRFNGGWGTYNIYTFHKGLINSEAKAENQAKGSVIFKSSNGKPITDWCFGGVTGPSASWSGSFSFYASKDGVTWKKITYNATMGDAYIASWAAYEYEFTGKLKASDGYLFLKITANPGGMAFLPAYRYLLYSTEGYDPDNIPPASSYLNRSESKNYFEKITDGYLFRSGSAMTDLDLHVVEPISDTPTVSVRVGDGTDSKWTDYLAKAFRRLVKDNGDGTGEYRYYNSYFASSKISWVEVTLNGAEFLYLDYNLASGKEDSERRHYEDVPVVEPMEDLDMDYVHSAFYDGKQTGISLITNASLHDNGSAEAAAFIGGQRGFLAWGDRDYSIIMETSYLRDFTLRFAYASNNSFRIRQINVYGRQTYSGAETKIPLVRHIAEEYASAGYQNYILRPAQREKLEDAGFNFVRIEVLCETYDDYSELMDFTYFYDLPELESMPAMSTPAADEKELLDRLEVPMLLEEAGGKACDAYNLVWSQYKAGFNDADDVLMQETFGAEAYITYHCVGIRRVDVRAYKSPDGTVDLQLMASPDGEEWTAVDADILEKALYDGWTRVAYVADSALLPAGTNYIRLVISDELELARDLMISDVQVLYTDVLEADEEPAEDEEFDEPADEPAEDEPSEDEPSEDETTTTRPTKKKNKKTQKSSAVEPWVWVAVAGGGVALLGGGTATTVLLVKKKKLKLSANEPQEE